MAVLLKLEKNADPFIPPWTTEYSINVDHGQGTIVSEATRDALKFVTADDNHETTPREGTTMVRVGVKYGDLSSDDDAAKTGRTHCEHLTDAVQHGLGDTIWYGYSLYIPSDFDTIITATKGFFICPQWHAPAPFAANVRFNLQADGNYVFHHIEPAVFTVNLGDVVGGGHWIQIAVGWLAKQNNEGWIELNYRIDGGAIQTVRKNNVRTVAIASDTDDPRIQTDADCLYADGSAYHWRRGIYTNRPAGDNTEQVIYYDQERIGDTLADVAPWNYEGAVTPTAPTVTTTSLSDGVVGTAYSQTLSATGGSNPLTWSTVTGTLPAGLTLSTAGVISGTPTTAATSNFTVRVTDSIAQTDDQALSIVVSAAPSDPGDPALDSGLTRFGYVDANGDPVIGVNRGKLGADKCALNLYSTGLTTSQQADIRKVWVYCGGDAAIAGTQKFRVVFYKDDGANGEPGTLIGQTPETTITSGEAESWHLITVTADTLNVTGVNVWMGIRSGATASLTKVAQDTVASANRPTDQTYTSAPTDPYGASTPNSIKRSVLADFVVEAGSGSGAGDTTAPTADSAEVNTNIVAITCSEDLDSSSVPAGSDFYVAVGGGSVGVSSVSIEAPGIVLTLARGVDEEIPVLISYKQPATGRVRDIAGNNMASFALLSASNITVVDDEPRLGGTRVVGGTRVIGGTKFGSGGGL